MEETIVQNIKVIERAWCACALKGDWDQKVGLILSHLDKEQLSLPGEDEVVFYRLFWLHRGIPGSTQVLASFIHKLLTNKLVMHLIDLHNAGTVSFLTVWARGVTGKHFEALMNEEGIHDDFGDKWMSPRRDSMAVVKKHHPVTKLREDAGEDWFLLLMAEAVIDMHELLEDGDESAVLWLLTHLASGIKAWMKKKVGHGSTMVYPPNFSTFFGIVTEIEALSERFLHGGHERYT